MGITTNEKLAPCPFCGPLDKEILKPKLTQLNNHWYRVNCGLCPAEMRDLTKYKRQAKITWNRRNGFPYSNKDDRLWNPLNKVKDTLNKLGD